MATTITKSVTQRGEPIATYSATTDVALKICDDDVSTYLSYSSSATLRIGIGNFNFNIPNEATITKVAFSTTADSTKGYAYINRYICTGLTSNDTSDPPDTQLAKETLFGTSTTISSPQEFKTEYTSSEFQNLITSAGLTTNIVDFLNNDVDVYFVSSNQIFKTHLIHIYDNNITVDYSVPAYTLTLTAGTGGSVSGGGTYESGTTATIAATPDTGYKFVKWSDGNTNATRTVTVTSDATYTAYFELDKINKLYVGTSQPKSLYVGNGTTEVKKVYADTQKVYG